MYAFHRANGVPGLLSAALQRSRFTGAWNRKSTAACWQVDPDAIKLTYQTEGVRLSIFGVGLAITSTVLTATCAKHLHCEAAEVHMVNTIPDSVSLKSSEVKLYQFESCPFCRKVRACLDYHQIPYKIIEVNPLSKAETKPIAPDYKKVPILRVDVEDGRMLQLRDSKTIVHALLATNNPGVAPQVPAPCATPSTSKMWIDERPGVGVEEQWLRWTDKVLVQCIVLNVYRTMEESAETFQYLLTHPSFPWFAQRSAAWSGTVVMWGVAQSRKRKYGILDVRKALFEAVDSFSSAVEAGGGEFIGGSKPGAVDFNVFGILRSAEACQTERDIFENCPSVRPWYSAMSKVVGKSCATNAMSGPREASVQ